MKLKDYFESDVHKSKCVHSMSSRCKMFLLLKPYRDVAGAPVAEWVKSWTVDLAVWVWFLLTRILSNVKRIPFHTAFHYYLTIILI